MALSQSHRQACPEISHVAERQGFLALIYTESVQMEFVEQTASRWLKQQRGTNQASVGSGLQDTTWHDDPEAHVTLEAMHANCPCGQW